VGRKRLFLPGLGWHGAGFGDTLTGRRSPDCCGLKAQLR
jgi:hypothetical protein